MRRSICWLPSRLLLVLNSIRDSQMSSYKLTDLRKSDLRNLFLSPNNSYIGYWKRQLEGGNEYLLQHADWKFISELFLVAQETLNEKKVK